MDESRASPYEATLRYFWCVLSSCLRSLDWRSENSPHASTSPPLALTPSAILCLAAQSLVHVKRSASLASQGSKSSHCSRGTVIRPRLIPRDGHLRDVFSVLEHFLSESTVSSRRPRRAVADTAVPRMASCASKTRLRKRPEDTCVSDVDSDPPPKKASVYDSSSLVSNADKKTSHASSSGARRLNDHPRGTGEGAVDEAPVYVHRILGSRRGYDKTRPPPASSSCESEGRIRAEAGGETRRSSRVGQVLELLSASGNGEQAASPGETTAPSSPHSIRVTASIDVAEQKGTVASNLSGKDSESESPQGESACSSCLNHRTSACSVSGHSPRQRSPAVRPGAAPSAVRPASRAPSSSIGSSPSASLARPPDGAKSLRQSLQAEDSSPTANAGRSCSSSACPRP